MLAEAFARMLPPILAQQIRATLFPLNIAVNCSYEFKKRAITGSSLIGSTGDFVAYPFSVQGYYNWRLWACALAVCKPGDRIIEVGANVGTETIGFSDIVGPKGEVVAFEPYPPNFSRLAEAIKYNRNHNIRLMPVALADQDRTYCFTLPPERNSGIGHLSFGELSSAQEHVQVEGRCLDTLVNAIGPAALISMDAEGSEIFILRGAKNYISQHKPILLLEADPRNNLKRNSFTLEDLYKEVMSLEYDVYNIGRLGLDAVNVHAPKGTDWFAAPKGKPSPLRRVNSVLLRSALLPPVKGLSPLAL